jgi:hypothetical protein
MNYLGSDLFIFLIYQLWRCLDILNPNQVELAKPGERWKEDDEGVMD